MQRLYSTSNIHLIFPEKSFYVFAKLWAILIRVIDINIGYLIPVIPKKSGERDIVTILCKQSSTVRAHFFRQIKSRVICAIGYKFAVMTFRTTPMRREGVDFRNASHGRDKGSTD